MSTSERQQRHLRTTTATSTSGLSVVIIGDAFADLYCYLDGDPPKSGGDARLLQPIHAVAGGSGLNTATHLCGLLAMHNACATSDAGRSGSTGGSGSGSGSGNNSSSSNSSNNSNVSLHTVLNEDDEYGKLLLSHAQKHGFQLVNCRRQGPENEEESSSSCSSSRSSSTGHCAVIVSNGERSFMTHLGVVSTFHADHVDADRIIRSHATSDDNDTSAASQHLHIHVAGYYNIAGFFNGRLKRLLEKILLNRRRKGNEKEANTAISLVPQHDATEEWDGGLLDLLPLIDYLILSELEARCIAKRSDKACSMEELAVFFKEMSSSTCVIVTRGSKGAVALKDGRIAHTQKAPMDIEDPVDPTGAGDAFVSGFLHGIYQGRGSASSGNGKGTLASGLLHGCVLGTSCVMRQGASVPATKDEIDALIDACTYE